VPAQNKVQIVVEVLRQKAEELQKISQDLKQLGTDGQEALKGANTQAGAFQGKISGVATAVKAAALAFAAFKAKQFLSESIDEAMKAQSAFTALAVTARFAGESIGVALGEASKLAADGLITVAEASQALQNLLSRGYDLGQSVEMLNRLKDAAAFNRQAHLSMGQAVVSATEGLKNENSILVDNAGVTKNVSVMWKEYAAQLGKSVEQLTQAEKRQAEYNGLLRETEGQVGNAARYAETAAGAQAKMNAEILRTKQQIGTALLPVMRIFWQGLAIGARLLADFAAGLEIVWANMVKVAQKAAVFVKRGGLLGMIIAPKGMKEQFAEIEAEFKKNVNDIMARWQGAIQPPDIGADTGKRRTDVVLRDQKKAVDDFVSGVKQSLGTLDLSIDKDNAVASFDEVQARLDQFADDYTGKLQRLQLDEKNYGNAVRTVQQEILKAKKTAAEQALAALKSSIDQSIAEEKRLAAEIQKIEDEQRKNKQSGADALRDIGRQQMTEEEKWRDRQLEMDEKLQAARDAMSRGETDRARELAREAQEIAKGLAQVPEELKLKYGEDVAKMFGIQEAERGIKASTDLIHQALQDEKDQLRETADANKQKLEELKAQFQELSLKVEEFRGGLARIAEEEIDLKIRLDASEAEQKIRELQQPTESVHTVRVQTVQESASGGLVRTLNAKRPTVLARGGRLAGYGGGDRIRALLEAGEFVIRKEAVKHYGAAFFEALNAIRINLPRLPAPQLPAIGNRQSGIGYAAGGMAGGGGSNFGTLMLQIPGGPSLEVQTSHDRLRQWERDVERFRKTR
jgi:hypothetical protein